MLFSQQNRDCRGTILAGCVIVGALVAILATFIASFWLGWFTSDSLTLLCQLFLGLTSVLVLLAIVGCSDFFETFFMMWVMLWICLLLFLLLRDEEFVPSH